MTSTIKIPTKRLFIGGVPYAFREGQLLSLFVTCGKVIDVRIIKDSWGKSRGMAYIEFANQKDAITAKEKFHNYLIQKDRTIIVDYAKPDPFLTPEGKARHQAAQKRKKAYRSQSQPSSPNRQTGESTESNRPFRFSSSRPSTEHVRQTIFNSRRHGARVGAKFARRTQNRKGHRS